MISDGIKNTISERINSKDLTELLYSFKKLIRY